jgi:hypothetical protein
VDAESNFYTFTRLPLSPCIETVGCPEWFRQDERRTLILKGMDRRVKTWIMDETGRSVAKAKPQTGGERVLRFRPVAGHDYYLFLYFSKGYEPKLPQRFSATMSTTAATIQFPPPPKARERPPTGGSK